MRLLLVEDNSDLARLTTKQLEASGFFVDWVEGVGDAKAVLDTRTYDAMVLDLGLPDGDGLKVLRHLRSNGNPLPVLILSARGAMEERVKGLDQGADDYLAKPFAYEELKARLAALLRRPGTLLKAELTMGNLRYDTVGRQALVDGKAVTLPAREAQLLDLLLRRAGKVVPKASLESDLFGLDDDFGSNAVEVYVHRLRKRMGDSGASVVIHTVRGVGYLITPG